MRGHTLTCPRRAICVSLLLAVIAFQATLAQSKPRARDLGIPFDGTPGPFNAITDVKGVVAAETMTGRDGNKAYAIPHDRLREVMKKYGRLVE